MCKRNFRLVSHKFRHHLVIACCELLLFHGTFVIIILTLYIHVYALSFTTWFFDIKGSTKCCTTCVMHKNYLYRVRNAPKLHQNVWNPVFWKSFNSTEYFSVDITCINFVSKCSKFHVVLYYSHFDVFDNLGYSKCRKMVNF